MSSTIENCLKPKLGSLASLPQELIAIVLEKCDFEDYPFLRLVNRNFYHLDCYLRNKRNSPILEVQFYFTSISRFKWGEKNLSGFLCRPSLCIKIFTWGDENLVRYYLKHDYPITKSDIGCVFYGSRHGALIIDYLKKNPHKRPKGWDWDGFCFMVDEQK